MTTNVNPTNVDFEGIRNSLREFLRTQTDLRDYDYDSSIISTLLNVHAYTTSLNAVYANLNFNEAYLDSALVRGNVVSRAQDIGYDVRTATGARATVELTVVPSDSPASVTIPRDTRFNATLDGAQVPFVLPSDLVIPRSETGSYVSNATIVQGLPLTHRFAVTTGGRYVLPNPNVDGSSLSVVEELANGDERIYKRFDNVTALDSTTQAFFVRENEDELVEAYFGDGVLGVEPTAGSALRVGYRVVVGVRGNGIRTFAIVNTTPHQVTVRTIENSEGGDDEEEIQSIKQNAPMIRRSLGRLITVDDYKSAIVSEFGDIAGVNVWGGENNDPPDYNSIYVSVQTRSSNFLSQRRQDEISEYLRRRGIIDRRHVFVRPTHLFVEPTVVVRYDPSRTSGSANDVLSAIRSAVLGYETTNLGTFGNNFYHSAFVSSLVGSDPSVLSVRADLRIQRRFSPSIERGRYTIAYNNAFRSPERNAVGTIVSDDIDYDGNPGSRFEDDGTGRVRVSRIVGGERTVTEANAGSVRYSSGVVFIESFVSTTNEIRVNAVPATDDVIGVRSQILFLTDIGITLVDDSLDTIVASVTETNTTGNDVITDIGFENDLIF